MLKTKKKIIIINQYGVTPDVPGATKHFDMATHFARKNEYKVEYWLSGLNHKTGKNHETLNGIRIQSLEKKMKNLKVIRIKGISYGTNLLLRQISIMLFDIITALKILFSRDIKYIIINTPPISIFNLLATKLRKKILVIDVEDLWPLFLIELGMKNKIAIKYMSFFSKYSYRVADKISVVSSGMMNYISNIEGVQKNIWISPLGIKIEDFMNKEKNYKIIEGKTWENDFKIMYLGAHGRANDLISVLDTIKCFNNKYGKNINSKKISFIFIGDGDQKENIVKYSETLNLKNVYFEDAVPSSLVAEYLTHADICLTNLQKVESFKLVRPNKIFQYMAVSKPIISGIWGEAEEIIKEAQAGLYVDFTNPSTAIDSINYLIVNEKLREKYGYNGRKYIEKYGDRNKIFNDYYSKLIKSEQ